MRLLLFPETEGGSAGSSSETGAHTSPPPSPAPAPTPGAPPPLAKLITESGVSEADASELVKTKQKLAEEERARKTAETRAAELEDTVKRLTTPPPAPTKKEKTKWLCLESED